MPFLTLLAATHSVNHSFSSLGKVKKRPGLVPLTLLFCLFHKGNMTFNEKELSRCLPTNPNYRCTASNRSLDGSRAFRMLFNLRIVGRLQPQGWQRRAQASTFRNHVAVLTDVSAVRESVILMGARVHMYQHAPAI
jgi:hypothetical protein